MLMVDTDPICNGYQYNDTLEFSSSPSVYLETDLILVQITRVMVTSLNHKKFLFIIINK